MYCLADRVNGMSSFTLDTQVQMRDLLGSRPLNPFLFQSEIYLSIYLSISIFSYVTVYRLRICMEECILNPNRYTKITSTSRFLLGIVGSELRNEFYSFVRNKAERFSTQLKSDLGP